MRIAHCSGCHQTFSVIDHFDAHRSSRGERGACLDPGSILYASGIRKGKPRYRRNAHGVWVSTIERPRL